MMNAIRPIVYERWRKLRRVVRLYRRPIITLLILAFVLPAAAITASTLIINQSKQYVLPANDHAAVKAKGVAVGMVLGAGVTKDGKPYKELQARLDLAAAALQHGDVKKLILSGDNRFKNYDEPTAMKNYLLAKYHFSDSQLQPDFAGRSTYESCQRAAQVFGQKRLVIYSAESHVPRAVYLCRHFGIEAYGVGTPIEANNASRREAEARVKAMYNVYVRGEPTVLGAPIKL